LSGLGAACFVIRLEEEVRMKVDFSAALAGHNVRKVGRDEGVLVEVLGLRMREKVKAKDTGYAFSVYEMELAPGQGVPLYTHPYPEFFHVLAGTLDVERLGPDGLGEWVRCREGESVHVPINAPHGFANRSDRPARFLSTSTYYHEAILIEVGTPVGPEDAVSPPSPEVVRRVEEVAARHQTFSVEAVDSGRLLDG
jgi:quercetin dioxygenase-like cupin family protein